MFKKMLLMDFKIPEDQKEDLYDNLTRENYSRILPILISLYIIEWIIYIFSDRFYDTSQIVLVYQVFNTIVIPIAIFIYRNLDKVPGLIARLVVYIIAYGSIAFGIALVMFLQELI